MNKNIPIIRKSLEDKLANNIIMLDISEQTVLTDFIVIADGSNVNHLDALVDSVTDELAREGIKPKTIEGNSRSGWVLIDYNNFIIHLFTHEMRNFYNLERIWMDGKKITD
ncbi:MAG: ribosome silencing factor [Clostridiales bacterium]|nr:ribosome silencing factor [Clostridiales bacterium]